VINEETGKVDIRAITERLDSATARLEVLEAKAARGELGCGSRGSDTRGNAAQESQSPQTPESER
jgi:hypothetical protein